MNVLKSEQQMRAAETLRASNEFKILLQAMEDKQNAHLLSAMSTTDPVLQAHYATRASTYTEFLTDIERIKN